MNRRWSRRLTPLALTFVLGLTAAPALAQNAPAEGEGTASEGRPLDGYLATACLAGAIIFAVCKSARR